MTRRSQREVGCVPGCPVEMVLDIIGGKWKGVILYNLIVDGTMRFNEIRRRLPNLTQRMLTNQLRELEASGLVSRTVYMQAPPRVDYTLTDLGHTLEPIILAMKDWGEKNLGDHNPGNVRQADEPLSRPRAISVQSFQ